MKPKLRFQGFHDDWEEKKLGEVLEDQYKGKKSKKSENGNLLLTTDYLDNREYSYVDELNNVNNKDILILWDGSQSGKVYTGYEGVLGSTFMKVSTYDYISSNYIYHFLNYNKKIIQERWRTGSGIPHVSKDFISSFLISLPSLPEQEKIGAFLSQLDDRIEKQEQKIELLKERKKGWMQQLFSQTIRFKDENGQDYPAWEEKKLGEFLSIPKKQKVDVVDKNKILTVKLHMKGIHKNNNTDTLKIGKTNYYYRYKGQFLYGKQNLFNGALGIVEDKYDGYYTSGDVPALDIDHLKVISTFLLQYMGQESFYKKLENIASGTGSKRIHESTLLELKIFLPSLPEQEKIAEFLSKQDELIEKEEEKLSLLKEQKKGFLQQMFV